MAGNGRAGASAVGRHSDSYELLLSWRENGDRCARQAFIERNLPLARQLARCYEQTPETLEDLVQVASVGLVKAVDRFDVDRGVAFSAFAVPTILGEVKELAERLGLSQEEVVEALGATAVRDCESLDAPEADRIGISQMQVSRLLRRAVDRLGELTRE